MTSAYQSYPKDNKNRIKIATIHDLRGHIDLEDKESMSLKAQLDSLSKASHHFAYAGEAFNEVDPNGVVVGESLQNIGLSYLKAEELSTTAYQKVSKLYCARLYYAQALEIYKKTIPNLYQTKETDGVIQ